MSRIGRRRRRTPSGEAGGWSNERSAMFSATDISATQALRSGSSGRQAILWRTISDRVAV